MPSGNVRGPLLVGRRGAGEADRHQAGHHDEGEGETGESRHPGSFPRRPNDLDGRQVTREYATLGPWRAVREGDRGRCGVVGLTCAVRLLEAGHRVDVVARDLPLETTSAVAAAIWYPYRALPRDKVTAWVTHVVRRLRRAGRSPRAGDPESGVRMLLGTEVFATAQADPWWAAAVPGLDRETSLPDGYVDGWTFATPVVEMPVYLPWLAGGWRSSAAR